MVDHIDVSKEPHEPVFIRHEDYGFDLDGLKAKYIQRSKENLETFLGLSPLESSVHSYEVNSYSATRNKQHLLVEEIMVAKYSAEQGKNYQAKWNATGKKSEVWTIDELEQLLYEIRKYVEPYVEKQREMEDKILKAENATEIYEVDIEAFN